MGGGGGGEGMTSSYQPPSKKVGSENNFLLNVKAKNWSCCKEPSLLECSLLLPVAENQDVKNGDTGTSCHSHSIYDPSIYHYSAKGNWPNHCGLMFSRWGKKQHKAVSDHMSYPFLLWRIDPDILSHRSTFGSSEMNLVSVSA